MKTYRQRLTVFGIVGAIMGVGAPLVLLNITLPSNPPGAASFLYAATAIGWVLVLIGREYYPFESI